MASDGLAIQAFWPARACFVADGVCREKVRHASDRSNTPNKTATARNKVLIHSSFLYGANALRSIVQDGRQCYPARQGLSIDSFLSQLLRMLEYTADFVEKAPPRLFAHEKA